VLFKLSKESEEKYPKNCMFQDKLCTNSCKGWDYEHNDCRLLGILWKITESINYLADNGIDVSIHKDNPIKEDSYYGGL
jgi:hypothetical protein